MGADGAYGEPRCWPHGFRLGVASRELLDLPVEGDVLRHLLPDAVAEGGWVGARRLRGAHQR